MIPWLILKALPGFAGFLELPASRPVLYAILAVLVLTVLAMRSNAVIPPSLHGFGVLLPLFAVVVLAHVGTRSAEAAELLINARALFLMITMLLLLRSGSSPRVVLIALMAYLAFAQVLGIFASAEAVVDPGTDVTEHRVTGIYGSSFTVGYSAVALVAVSLMVREVFQQRIIRLLALACLAMGVTTAFLAINRTSIAAVVLVVGGWFVQRVQDSNERGRWSGSRVAVALVALGVTVLAFVQIALWVAPRLVEFYTSLWQIRLEALAVGEGQDRRWLTIVAGWRMFVDHPLLGVGWDRAADYAEAYGADMAASVHNVFLQGAAEGGIVGLTFVVALFVLIPAHLLRLGRDVPGRWVFAGGWMAILFYNLIASNLHLESHWDVLLAWILVLSACRAPAPAAVPVAAPLRHIA